MTQICPLYDERARLRAIVDRLQPELVGTLALVKQRAPDARVLLVGYPKLLPSRGGCARLPGCGPQDRATFREMNLRLRYAMRDAAAEAGVEFVDFYGTSIGHDMCSRHPWVQGRVGSSRRGAALHPLPSGQAALARIDRGSAPARAAPGLDRVAAALQSTRAAARSPPAAPGRPCVLAPAPLLELLDLLDPFDQPRGERPRDDAQHADPAEHPGRQRRSGPRW